MSDHEDDPPLLRPVPDPEATRSTLPPAEAGTEASALQLPRMPPIGPVGIETILIAIREVRESVHIRIDQHGEDVSGLIRAVGQLGGRVSGIENAVNRRRERDEANQESMRTAIHNMGTAVEGLRGEITKRFDALESRVAKLEEWRDSLSPEHADNGSNV